MDPIIQGERLDVLEAGEWRVVRTRHPADLRLPWHVHERASVLFVTAGSLVESFGSMDYELEPGSVLVKPAGSLHADRFGPEGATSMILELPASVGDVRRPSISTVKHFTSGPVPDLAARIHREIAARDSATPILVEGLALQLVGWAARRRSQGRRSVPAWLRRVRERVESEFAEGVSVRDLADEADVHPDHVSRRFKAEYGIAIGEYVRRLRLERVEEALRTSDRPLTEIAESTGFVDPSHLVKTFKRYFGLTPGRFRDRVGPAAASASIDSRRTRFHLSSNPLPSSRAEKNGTADRRAPLGTQSSVGPEPKRRERS